MQREQVYQLIDSERDYQDEKWGNLDHSIDELILYISAYSNELVKIAGTTLNRDEKLNFVRKIGGLAVACLEKHGGKPRPGKVIQMYSHEPHRA